MKRLLRLLDEQVKEQKIALSLLIEKLEATCEIIT